MTLSRNWTMRLASWRPSIKRNWERCRNKGRQLESYRRPWQRVTLNWTPLAKPPTKRWVEWSLFYTHNETFIFIGYSNAMNMVQIGKMLYFVGKLTMFYNHRVFVYRWGREMSPSNSYRRTWWSPRPSTVLAIMRWVCNHNYVHLQLLWILICVQEKFLRTFSTNISLHEPVLLCLFYCKTKVLP